MAGPVAVADVGIILGALVHVLDQERDRRAGGDLPARAVVAEDAGQDLHLVGFAPLRGETRLAGPAAVEFGLDLGGLQWNARRASVHHAAQRDPMALAEGGDAEEVAEGVVRHGGSLGGKPGGVTCRPLSPPAGRGLG
jgi:hypothetical protein